MPEPINNTVVVESLVRELCAVKLEIMECEPVAALKRIDRLLDALADVLPRGQQIGAFSD
jgi:hypothetical protein